MQYHMHIGPSSKIMSIVA